MAEKEYIEREAAIAEVEEWHDMYPDSDAAREALSLTKRAIRKLPAADVRPVVRKPVVGYEGLYFITNDGEVTNADGIVMKQHAKKGNGTCYKSVSLYKDGQYKTKYVHRLVAEAFIPNPENLPIINHKDEDGTNNKVENLEWCTHQYNVNYGTARERQREKLVGVPHTKEHKKKISDSLYQHYDEGFVGRRVVCLETGVVYDSVAKAARDLGISEAAVRMSCNRGSTKGYKYTFRDMREES
jgi:hypothetical protein